MPSCMNTTNRRQKYNTKMYRVFATDLSWFCVSEQKVATWKHAKCVMWHATWHKTATIVSRASTVSNDDSTTLKEWLFLNLIWREYELNNKKEPYHCPFPSLPSTDQFVTWSLEAKEPWNTQHKMQISKLYSSGNVVKDTCLLVW